MHIKLSSVSDEFMVQMWKLAEKASGRVVASPAAEGSSQ